MKKMIEDIQKEFDLLKPMIQSEEGIKALDRLFFYAKTGAGAGAHNKVEGLKKTNKALRVENGKLLLELEDAFCRASQYHKKFNALKQELKKSRSLKHTEQTSPCLSPIAKPIEKPHDNSLDLDEEEAMWLASCWGG